MRAESMTPTHLRCEYLVNPIGIDTAVPRLSWRLTSTIRGARQSAYRILVASSTSTLSRDQGDLWDSGKIESSETSQVVYSGKRLSSGLACHWKVQTWDGAGTPSGWSAVARWSMGPMESSDWTAKWIGIEAPIPPTQDPLPAQMLRKEFSLTQPIRRAVVHVSALGLYELRLNGERVGNHLLAPEWTDYPTRVQYQTYEVTGLLRAGANALAAHLGDGWYSGRIGLSNIVPDGPLRGIYGPRPRLLVQLEIESEAGRKERVVSDGSWRVSCEGPIRSADILDGEVYDARREKPGWDQPGFEDSDWKPVQVEEDFQGKLVAQRNEPIRVVEELKPIAITEPAPGVYIFDLGQNMVGWCRARIGGEAGRAIRLRHGEALKADGTLYRDNLRMPSDGGPLGARQEDLYICRGEGTEWFEPHFTYHGFRYVEVTGLAERPNLDSLVGRVFCSSAPETATFECSEPMLNRLMKNILWTQRGNLMSVPTDCPQRDERLGWMGDAGIFSPAACFNMDMAAFFTKWLQDVRDSQAADGRFPDFAPHPFGPNERFSGVPAWGDAGVIVPWVVYRWYGDRRLIETHFQAAARWVDRIAEKNPDRIWRNSRGNDYGDWLNGDTLIREGWPRAGAAIPKEIFATLLFANSATLVAKMAAVIGKEREAEKYSELARTIRAAFVREFVDSEGRIQGDTQAGYALALSFGMLPVELEAKAFTHMVEAIEEYNHHLSTGIISTLHLMNELANRGQVELAYRLLTQRTFPSWGYAIEQGATTIWERWDGYVEGRGFQDPGMNSFNHYALGAVGEFIHRNILGINPDTDHPGFAHARIHPRPGGGLTWARGAYDSIRGPIRVSWRINDAGGFRLEVELPANTSGTVYLPAREAAQVSESGKSLPEAEGILASRVEGEVTAVEVGSGAYAFEVSRP